MFGKRSFVLLVLAAILAMHGTPCLADNPAAGHAMTMGPVAGLQMAAVSTSLGETPAEAPQGTDASRSATSPVIDASSPHGSMAGAWAACLAVFLAGIVGVAALLLGRRSRTSITSLLDRGRIISWRAAPPSPPDLSVLCLLRV